jgi:uncharacterized delta-60 repeat protein
MKKRNIPRLGAFCVSMYFLTATAPFSLKAQSGLNDATFNKPDKTAAQGANGPVEVLANYGNKLLIAGNFSSYNGSTTNKLARLKADGTLDKTFNAGTGPNGKIRSILTLSNNKILLAGDFNRYNNLTAYGIVRLFPDGSPDLTFNFEYGPNKGIYKLAFQGDHILVAGNFKPYPETANNVIRISSSGVIDTTFHPQLGVLNDIQQMVVQPDGKILLAGSLLIGSSTNYCGVIRLNNDGSPDLTFQTYIISLGDYRQYIGALALETPGTILLASNVLADGAYYQGSLRRLDSSGNQLAYVSLFWTNSYLLQNDGKIVAAGFKQIARDAGWYVFQRAIVRLNTNLTIDSSYHFDDEKLYAQYPYTPQILTSVIQADDKVVIGGAFTETSGYVSNNIARLYTNGSFDTSFNAHKGSSGTILTSAVLKNGKTLIGGRFDFYNNSSAHNFARLNKNGQLDGTFQNGNGTNGKVYTIAVQSNNKILIGGDFTSYDGHTCHNIARLNPDGSFDQGFASVTPDDVVRKIKLDNAGKITVAGDFKSINGVPSPGISRLLTNGTVDNTFQLTINDFYTPAVYDFAFLPSGKLYVALNFKARYYRPVRAVLLRLFNNGNIDSTFTAPEFLEIYTIALKSTNKPVIGGYEQAWIGYNGFVAQLKNDGALDSAFQYSTLKSYLNGPVRTITALNNDKLIVAGDFSKNITSNLDHIALLNKNGSIDNNFIGTANGGIYTASVAANEQLFIGGSFSQYSTVPRNGAARIDISVNAYAPEVPATMTPLTENRSVNLYPNPAQSTIIAAHLKPGTIIKIFNTVGQELFSQSVLNETTSIDLSDFGNGVYFFVSEWEGERSFSKFVVNKQ